MKSLMASEHYKNSIDSLELKTKATHKNLLAFMAENNDSIGMGLVVYS